MYIFKMFLLYFVLFVFSSNLVFGLIFTEVMYDPLGSDNNKEWVELFGSPINDSVMFVEGENNHLIRLVQGNCFSNCSIIIADDANFFLSEFNVSGDVLVYDSSWSSLRNSGELLQIIDTKNVNNNKNKSVLAELFFIPIAEEGNSIQLVDYFWVSRNASPGFFDREFSENLVPEFSSSSIFLLLIIFIIYLLFVKSG